MCTQVWAWMTNKCWTRMDRREIYKVRDLPQLRGGGVSDSLGGKGHRFLLRVPGESDQMGIHTLGRGARFLGL